MDEPHIEYRTSESIGELFAALAKAQGEILPASKNAVNPHFKSRYAGLSSIVEACRVALSKNGIAVSQVPHNADRDIGLTTILGHSSGQWISGSIHVAPAKWDAQAVGSVLTYLRRYALAAMAGVAPVEDDDDAEAGVDRAAFSQPTSTRGVTRSASPRPAAPPLAAAASNGSRPGWVDKFLARDSYDINPEVLGGWSEWEKAYLTVTKYVSLAQLTKLKTDNSVRLVAFRKAVRPEVAEHFRESVEANERRLAQQSDAAAMAV